MSIIIDSRMRKVEKEYLAKFDELVEILPQDMVYEEVSGHPDIFFCKIKSKIFRAPDLNMDIGEAGEENLDLSYPEDVKYNVCQIGDFVVHNFDFTDKKVLNFIDEVGLKKINVKQGYSNCSISVISDNACITSDAGIYEALKRENIDVILLDSNNIRLLDKNGTETKMKGFIGGASHVIDSKFILFGDINFLEEKNKLIEFLKKYNIELIDFKDLPIYDYGGIIQV